MNLTLTRDVFGKTTTLGCLSIDGAPFGFVCEDEDRGLASSMPLEEIKRIKVKKETAIPTGHYKVGIRFSPSHNKEVMYLIDVPGFQFIELHPGNDEGDTEGCQLPGLVRDVKLMTVGKSKLAVEWLERNVMPRIRSHDDVWYTIERDDTAWVTSPWHPR